GGDDVDIGVAVEAALVPGGKVVPGDAFPADVEVFGLDEAGDGEGGAFVRGAGSGDRSRAGHEPRGIAPSRREAGICREGSGRARAETRHDDLACPGAEAEGARGED